MDGHWSILRNCEELISNLHTEEFIIGHTAGAVESYLDILSQYAAKFPGA